jgi:hypothetical protein
VSVDGAVDPLHTSATCVALAVLSVVVLVAAVATAVMLRRAVRAAVVTLNSRSWLTAAAAIDSSGTGVVAHMDTRVDVDVDVDTVDVDTAVDVDERRAAARVSDARPSLDAAHRGGGGSVTVSRATAAAVTGLLFWVAVAVVALATASASATMLRHRADRVATVVRQYNLDDVDAHNVDVDVVAVYELCCGIGAVATVVVSLLALSLLHVATSTHVLTCPCLRSWRHGLRTVKMSPLPGAQESPPPLSTAQSQSPSPHMHSPTSLSPGPSAPLLHGRGVVSPRRVNVVPRHQP